MPISESSCAPSAPVEGSAVDEARGDGVERGDGADLVVGIFVGGASSRMGSPKGLLRAPGEQRTLVERTHAVATSAFSGASCVLVGRRPEYADVALGSLADAAQNGGPLGGLVALLRYAEARRLCAAVVLACDLPFLEPALVARLGEAREASALAPRELACGQRSLWQPLFARYAVELLPDCERALEQGTLGLQPLLERHATELLLSPGERRLLRDWDRPEDLDPSGVEPG